MVAYTTDGRPITLKGARSPWERPYGSWAPNARIG